MSGTRICEAVVSDISDLSFLTPICLCHLSYCIVCGHVLLPVYMYLTLFQYCVKKSVDAQLVNILHSLQQHTAAIYFSVCVM
jgi:hypothetical protein